MFKSSYSIGKIAGIPIKIHISFLLILPFLAWAFSNNIQYITESSSINSANLLIHPYILGLILALALFFSVLLHELSHSLIARQKGMEINSITLMLFGGVSNMEEISENPSDEARMALAGPALSIILGLLLLGMYSLLPEGLSADLRLIVLYIGELNIFLAVFNLLPAFPSDGGRILRALIARKKNYLKATRIAAAVGKGFAFFFGIFGLISGNFLLIFIAFFLYIGASQEYQFNLVKNALSDLTIGDLMSRDVSVVSENLSIKGLLDRMFDERHSGYPVVAEGKVIGMVTMEDVQKINRDEYNSIPVRQIMSREIKKVTPGDDLYQAFKMLFKEDIGRLVVVEGEELKGIITRTDILKGFKVKQLQGDF